MGVYADENINSCSRNCFLSGILLILGEEFIKTIKERMNLVRAQFSIVALPRADT